MRASHWLGLGSTVAVAGLASETLSVFVNSAPVAANDTDALDEGVPVAFDLLANDNEADAGNALSVAGPVVTSANATATLDADGNLVVTYTDRRSLFAGETDEIIVTQRCAQGQGRR